MGYESQISFTLDTICPWTYLAKKRLDAALDEYRSAHPDSPVKFTVKYFPYQLYPEASTEGEGKYEWYKKSKYGDSEEKMRMYTTIMSAYGRSVGIDFKFGGTVANTLDAHRLIQRYQELRGPECAEKLINSLYSQYFENEQHPSSLDTLLRASNEAGIPEDEVKEFLENESEGLQDVKLLVREQEGNGIDSVPTIVFEGKKRDFAFVGAKEIREYVKTMEQIAKEA